MSVSGAAAHVGVDQLERTDDGLPVGVQLVGRPFAESMLLQVAHQLETAMPWVARRPAAFV